eukprot:gnl/MRDRNA2_/MRDRNA2_146237_c0_seq1.p1 gnl/MRDRNA2_/MRDRNA2_146237_c0~~gnl/MRDRNA2_/MRDRNA2_146237_c0_seq1.p1  ORF type:complete len:240 (+),score=42.77 gnl/MRDRNA2_/MRDRNA2_146237_c0_seq1:65-721(+)
MRSVFPSTVAATAIRDCPEVLRRAPSAIFELQDALKSIGLPFTKTVKRWPRMLLWEATTVHGAFAFLLDKEIGPGMTHEQASRLVNKVPGLLGKQNAAQRFAPLVHFFREILRVDPASEACTEFYDTRWADPLGMLNTSVEFLTTTCGYSMEEVCEDLSLLGYSFEQRLYPRSLYAQKLGVPRPSLSALASTDDLKFCQIVGSTVDDFREFQKQVRKA